MSQINNQHPLLKRQLNKFHFEEKSIETIGLPFIETINETYVSNDQERQLLERSLEISSEELLEKNSQLSTIFQAFPDVFFRIDFTGKILDYKAASMNISSILPQQLIGSNIKDTVFFKNSMFLSNALNKVSTSDELIAFEDLLNEDNKKCYFEVRVKSLLKNQAIIIIRDITERKIAEDQLKFNALHDSLTSLPNRTLLLERLSIFIERKKRNPKYNFAILFIDFDRFKLVNDSLGHSSGDIVLIAISQRLQNSLRGVDSIARLGGDEFCAILDDVKVQNDAVIVAERIQKMFCDPLFVGNREIFLTLSVGIVMSLDDEQRSAEDYIREADIAMYNAKSNGRAQYSFFTKEMHQKALKTLDLEGDFRRAIENDEFHIFYQPVISLIEKKVVRMEALVRWIHPQKGFIMPLDFIYLAEETGHIFQIGEVVLNKACEQCRHWQEQGLKDLEIAVNFSALQFHQTNIAELIKGITKSKNLDPKYLEIEITESIAMRDMKHTINILNALKEMNVRIAVDDFGTGHSSLGSLIELPINSLKIDRKFLNKVPNEQKDSCLVMAIIGLAHNLGLKVVAEGIESNDQLSFLMNNQCDEGQGYLFAKPLPFKEAFENIKKINAQFS